MINLAKLNKEWCLCFCIFLTSLWKCTILESGERYTPKIYIIYLFRASSGDHEKHFQIEVGVAVQDKLWLWSMNGTQAKKD